MRVGGVFGDTVVGWCVRGVVTPHPMVAYLVFSVVQYLYEVERKAPTKPPPNERENVMAISATLEARSTTILNNLDSLANAAKKGARKVAKKPASQGPLNLADRIIFASSRSRKSSPRQPAAAMPVSSKSSASTTTKKASP